MKYEDFNYLYPPRPENPILPYLISFYEKKGWIGQIKKNGTCSIIAIGPNNQFISMSRHNTNHKAWKGYEPIESYMKSLYKDGWLYFVGELLHSKTTSIKNKIYIHDILVYNGEYLVGKTWQERQDLLDNLLPNNEEADDHYKVTSDIWRAKNFTSNLSSIFKNLKNIEDEGLVLKNPKSVLSLCNKASANNEWQVKSRKESKNYGF